MSTTTIEWTEQTSVPLDHKVDHQDINQCRMAASQSRFNPFVLIAIPFAAVARAAARHNVTVLCFAVSADRVNMIPSVSRIGTIRTSAIEAFEKIGLCLCGNVINATLSTDGVLSPFGAVSRVYGEAATVRCVSARPAFATSDFRCQPSFAPAAPRNPEHLIHLSFSERRPGRLATRSAGHADSVSPVVSGAILSEETNRNPSLAFVAPFLSSLRPQQVFVERNADAFRRDLH